MCNKLLRRHEVKRKEEQIDYLSIYLVRKFEGNPARPIPQALSVPHPTPKPPQSCRLLIQYTGKWVKTFIAPGTVHTTYCSWLCFWGKIHGIKLYAGNVNFHCLVVPLIHGRMHGIRSILIHSYSTHTYPVQPPPSTGVCVPFVCSRLNADGLQAHFSTSLLGIWYDVPQAVSGPRTRTRTRRDEDSQHQEDAPAKARKLSPIHAGYIQYAWASRAWVRGHSAQLHCTANASERKEKQKSLLWLGR